MCKLTNSLSYLTSDFPRSRKLSSFQLKSTETKLLLIYGKHEKQQHKSQKLKRRKSLNDSRKLDFFEVFEWKTGDKINFDKVVVYGIYLLTIWRNYLIIHSWKNPFTVSSSIPTLTPALLDQKMVYRYLMMKIFKQKDERFSPEKFS